jgi:superfamily I DNA and/or RNA helicase
MERNILIVSTVRNNNRNDFGFAKEIQRINVAFSRAKRLLIVVGSRDFFIKNSNYSESIGAMENISINQLKNLAK